MIISGDAIRIVPPAALPISLAELKAQTRVNFADEDALMLGYIRAAVEMCENFTGLGFITQTWTQTFSSFPTTSTGALLLRRRPLQEILSVNYLDGAGADTVLGTTIYRAAGIGADRSPSSIWLSDGSSWPTILPSTLEAVTVTYTVGFGDDHNFVPELIRQAVMMAAATWFNFREDVVQGQSVQELPFNSKVLLLDWRELPVV